MTSSEIRRKFLDFFESKEHKIVSSSPVVPYDDPTLLFINAGMNQFKDVFLGTGSRSYKRAADTQKCIRVSGKHNDLEEVGYDTYHHTFFEMLGNWSFGDYYKQEAIMWAWEFLTEVIKLPKNKLWVTVYRTDDEAFNLWKDKTDINPAHILRFNEKDNFWEMGDTGPCGPCSEIHINLSGNDEDGSLVNAGSPECIEIWNLVFIQYNREKDGSLTELPQKHVDTGMGFERLCRVIQNKSSNYDTDVFVPLIKKISELSGIPYEKEDDQISMRVISDHIRTLTFAISDGAAPGNEGRGYVLRRILRRAARYGRKLNLKEPFLYKLTDVLGETMGNVFPEVVEKKNNVKKIIKAEEESFNSTLDRGLDLFEQISGRIISSGGKVISGTDVFKLYDTYGFPVDLTNVLAKEKGLIIDENGFNTLMDEQRERARKVTKDKQNSVVIDKKSLDGFKLADRFNTTFTGYEELETKSKIVGIKTDDTNTFVILEKTPFYAESGGQVSDKGKLIIGGKEYSVINLYKFENSIIHVIEKASSASLGTEVTASVDRKYRWNIMRNHSATHFLHKALRQVLGNHVQQSGSYVGADRLRFDFTHFEKLKDEDILQIEKIVNDSIRMNYDLQHHKNTPFEQAKKMGALMFFGDKYGDSVNVVQFGDCTLEFCGGTHVKNSSQIGILKIISETSIASGVRRIEALTGEGVENYINEQNNEIRKAEEKISQLIEERKKLEKELAELHLKEKLGGIDSIVKNPADTEGIKVFKGKVDAAGMDELKSMGDDLRNKIISGVGVLISAFEEKVGIVCVVSDDLIKSKNMSAGKIVGEAAKIVGGGGGGRPHLATAGGKDISKIEEALENVEKIIKGMKV
ncbi:MAG: alanine--tRNA ligase [Ignavibacteria bacterium]|nr:alanine--tRNA ligase [Ignavibacteria bacterium]